ncbi:hypothetical protein B0H67DRAFT_345231 [Lasiosphaeris hirsuta]|uniref:Uncharacterized protein n=1 Tax=Lasiosphaeris hirsuta TaxID=260670 RepID=A0AA40DQS3_9PEZI|nr:hypothetical protein B0H67DRAFT_345231 [Lasiosphaeris hirsuta]
MSMNALSPVFAAQYSFCLDFFFYTRAHDHGHLFPCNASYTSFGRRRHWCWFSRHHHSHVPSFWSKNDGMGRGRRDISLAGQPKFSTKKKHKNSHVQLAQRFCTLLVSRNLDQLGFLSLALSSIPRTLVDTAWTRGASVIPHYGTAFWRTARILWDCLTFIIWRVRLLGHEKQRIHKTGLGRWKNWSRPLSTYTYDFHADACLLGDCPFFSFCCDLQYRPAFSV